MFSFHYLLEVEKVYVLLSLVYDKLRHPQLKNTQKVSITIVVSPLSALMQEQVTKFSSQKCYYVCLFGGRC